MHRLWLNNSVFRSHDCLVWIVLQNYPPEMICLVQYHISFVTDCQIWYNFCSLILSVEFHNIFLFTDCLILCRERKAGILFTIGSIPLPSLQFKGWLVWAAYLTPVRWSTFGFISRRFPGNLWRYSSQGPASDSSCPTKAESFGVRQFFPQVQRKRKREIEREREGYPMASTETQLQDAEKMMVKADKM